MAESIKVVNVQVIFTPAIPQRHAAERLALMTEVHCVLLANVRQPAKATGFLTPIRVAAAIPKDVQTGRAVQRCTNVARSHCLNVCAVTLVMPISRNA